MSTGTAAPVRATAGSPALSQPSLLRLTRVELRKTYDTRAGFWLLMIIGIVAVAVVALLLGFGDDQNRTFSEYFAVAQLPISILLPVLGILSVTSEWSQRTAMATFALVPRRSRVIVAKLLAAVVLSVVAVAASVVAAAVGNLLTPVLTSSPGSWSIESLMIPTSVLAQLIVVLVGSAFGLALLSSPLAIVLYFFIPTVFTVVVSLSSALDWVQEWLDLTTTTMPLYIGEVTAQEWGQIGTTLLLWLVLPLVVGWLRVGRREIS